MAKLLLKSLRIYIVFFENIFMVMRNIKFNLVSRVTFLNRHVLYRGGVFVKSYSIRVCFEKTFFITGSLQPFAEQLISGRKQKMSKTKQFL